MQDLRERIEQLLNAVQPPAAERGREQQTINITVQGDAYFVAAGPCGGLSIGALPQEREVKQ